MNRYALAFTAAILPTVLAGAQAKASDDVLGPRLASDLITLLSTNGSAACVGPGAKFDFIENPDGTQSKFSGIPTGKVLVITGFSFTEVGSNPGNHTARVFAEKTANQALLVQAFGVTDATGFAAGSVSLTTGVEVKPGPDLCFVPTAAGIIGTAGLLHGYLTSK